MSLASAAVPESEASIQVTSVKLRFLGQGVTNRTLRDEAHILVVGGLGVGSMVRPMGPGGLF